MGILPQLVVVLRKRQHLLLETLDCLLVLLLLALAILSRCGLLALSG